VEWLRPNLNGIEFPILAQENAEMLTEIFTMEEISEVVKGCDGSKARDRMGSTLLLLSNFGTS
jgi:hypothetical protein